MSARRVSLIVCGSILAMSAGVAGAAAAFPAMGLHAVTAPQMLLAVAADGPRAKQKGGKAAVNKAPARPAKASGGRPQVRNNSHTTINNSRKDVDININKNTNVKINNDYDNRHHHHHHDWDNDWDDDWHPVATVATVAITAAIIGSIVNSLPPDCDTVYVNGITYSRCGNNWYQPRYYGSSVQYVVVVDPR